MPDVLSFNHEAAVVNPLCSFVLNWQHSWLSYCNLTTYIQGTVCCHGFQPLCSLCRPIMHPYTKCQQNQFAAELLPFKYVHVHMLKLGERAFGVAAPRLWNELPPDIRKSSTLGILKHFYSVNTTVKSLNNNCSAFMYTNSVFLTLFQLNSLFFYFNCILVCTGLVGAIAVSRLVQLLLLLL